VGVAVAGVVEEGEAVAVAVDVAITQSVPRVVARSPMSVRLSR